MSDIYNKKLSRSARIRDGLDVVIHVIGDDHLKILRTVTTGEEEPVQLFPRLQFEGIIFEKFPKVGGEAYGFWAKNPIGDITEMLMQMLVVSFTFYIMPLS